MIEHLEMHQQRVRCMSAERVLAYFHEALQGSGAVTTLARCEGLLDEDRFRAALTRLQAHHAKLRVAIVWDEREWPSFELRDPVDPIPCDVATLDDPEAFRERVAHLPDANFVSSSAPLARFHLWHCPSAGVTEVIGCFHHAIVDGLAGWLVLQDLLRFYADPEAPLAPADDGFSRQVDIPNSPLADAWWMAKAVVARFYERRFRRLEVPAKNAPPPGAFDRWSWSAADTAALTNRCRAEGVTVFAALAVSSCRAIAGQFDFDGRSIAWHAPISVRSQMTPPYSPDAIGMFVTSLRCYQRLSERGDFWEAARQFRQDWDRRLAYVDPVRGLKLTDRVSLNGAMARERAATMSLSNLGRLKEYAVPGQPRVLDFCAFARTNDAYPLISLHVGTIGDRIGFSLRSESLQGATLHDMGERMQALLRQAAGISTNDA